MPQVNEFSWLFCSFKLILMLFFVLLYLNYIYSLNFFSSRSFKKLFYMVI